jgi:hypothetical protein
MRVSVHFAIDGGTLTGATMMCAAILQKLPNEEGNSKKQEAKGSAMSILGQCIWSH